MQRSPGKHRRFIPGFIVWLTLCTIISPAAFGAAPEVAGSGWVSRDKSGGIMRLMEFRKDGTFVDMTDQHIYTGSWKQEGGSITAAVKYRELTTSAGMENDEYIMYLAGVVDGRLKGTSAHYNVLERKRFWEQSFELERETTCAGERGISGNRLHCIDPATRKGVTPLPHLSENGSREGGKPENFDMFLRDFVSAARMNMSGNLAARVRFPLEITEFFDAQLSKEEGSLLNKRIVKKAVSSADFPKIALWPAEREIISSSTGRQIFNSEPENIFGVREGPPPLFASRSGQGNTSTVFPKLDFLPTEREKNSSFKGHQKSHKPVDIIGYRKNLLPPFPARPGRSVLSPWQNGATLWHFIQIEGKWFLDEVQECHGNDCPEALYCGEGHPKNAFLGSAEEGEDFYEFFHVLYCAMLAGNRDLVIPRIKFPLPYSSADTETEGHGLYRTEKQLNIASLYACDGYPLPPSLSVYEFAGEAEASIPRDGTGCQKGLSFKQIDGLWYVVHVQFDSY